MDLEQQSDILHIYRDIQVEKLKKMHFNHFSDGKNLMWDYSDFLSTKSMRKVIIYIFINQNMSFPI